MTTRRALVLGGGGIAGIAWETGVLQGIADESPDCGAGAAGFRRAGRHLGRLGGRRTDRQRLEPRGAVRRDRSRNRRPKSIRASASTPSPTSSWPPCRSRTTTVAQKRQRIGAVALATETVAEPVRRDVIAQRLPSHDWPDRVLRVTAIDIATGGTRCVRPRFGCRAGRRGGGQLRGAGSVAAGDDRGPALHGRRDRQHDQPATSPTTATMAVVLVPAGVSAPSPFGPGPVAEIAAFRGTALGVFADDESLAAFGPNPLDPRCRIASAEAGRAQGRREAAGRRRVPRRAVMPLARCSAGHRNE